MASFHREARLDTLALFAITAIAGVAIAVALRTGLDFSSQLERLLHAGRVLFQ